MTVEIEQRYITYSPDGSSVGPFAVPFKFFEIGVYLDDALVDPSEYTIDQDEPGLTGSITFETEPDGALLIVSETDAIQETDYVENEDFPAETHEQALDRLALAIQDLERRSLRSAPNGFGTELFPEEHPGAYLHVNDDGEFELVAVEITGSELSAAQILSMLTTVDGDGSGLDADTVKGQNAVLQKVVYENTISPTALSGNVNNYAPTDFDTSRIIRVDPNGANREISGIAGGEDGMSKYLVNLSATYYLILKAESGSSVAANRFSTDYDIMIPPKRGREIVYDGTSARWRIIGGGGIRLNQEIALFRHSDVPTESEVASTPWTNPGAAFSASVYPIYNLTFPYQQLVYARAFAAWNPNAATAAVSGLRFVHMESGPTNITAFTGATFEVGSHTTPKTDAADITTEMRELLSTDTAADKFVGFQVHGDDLDVAKVYAAWIEMVWRID